MPTRNPPLSIQTPPDFDLAATVRFMRFTEAEIVDAFDAGVYRRALHLSSADGVSSLHVASVEQRPGESSLALTIEPRADADARAHAATTIESMFSTDHDLRSFRSLAKRDAALAPIERAHRGLHLPRWASLFEALTISMLLQQISTHVAYVLKRRFVERFGENLTIGGRTSYAFPLPARVAAAEHDELRALGLSGAKARGILELARFFVSEPRYTDALVSEDNETIIRRLSTLRGVGRWTAEWALMLYFGRTDVFPAGDLALRAVVSKYYFDRTPIPERELRLFALERWGAQASYVCVYLFAGLRAGLLTLERGSQSRVLSSTARLAASPAPVGNDRSP